MGSGTRSDPAAWGLFGDGAVVEVGLPTCAPVQVLARAQKEQLQVLLDEIKEGSGNERYRAALDGKRLGTRAQGTTAGAVAIRRSGTDGS